VKNEESCILDFDRLTQDIAAAAERALQMVAAAK